MMLRTFLQAFAIVFLTSLNVSQIVAGHYPSAFLVGCGISALWWQNSKATRPSGLRFHLAYTIGAGCGTLAGMFVGRI